MTTTLIDSPATDVRPSPAVDFIKISGDLDAHRGVEYRLSLTSAELNWLRAHGFSARMIADRMLEGVTIDAQQVLERLAVTRQARAIVHSNLYSNLGMMNRSSYRQALGYIGNNPVRVVKGASRINHFFTQAQRDITKASEALESDAGLSAMQAEDLGYLRSSTDALMQAVSSREHRKDSAMLYLALPTDFVDQFGVLASTLSVTRRRIVRWLLAELVAQELSWGARDDAPGSNLFTHQRAGAALSLPLVHGYAALDSRIQAHASNAVALEASVAM